MSVYAAAKSTTIERLPAVILLVLWGVAGANCVLHRGWRGGLGQILGIDFIIFYTGGLLYRFHPAALYNFAAQLQLEQRLLYPTPLAGSGPFSNPPFTGLVLSALTHMPLLAAFVCWSALQLICTAVALHLAGPLVPVWLREAGLNRTRLLVVVLSTYPFVEGLTAGQIHGTTLLLVTLVCVASLRDADFLAGVAAGLLLYKPQFTLGFVILWIACRRWKSLVALAVVGAAWSGFTALTKGIAVYAAFVRTARELMLLPYTPGWPRALMVTPYGLLTSVLPYSAAESTANILALAMAAVLFWAALRRTNSRPELLASAALFPLVATPYALVHDLLILVPVLLLLAHAGLSHEKLLQLTVFAYLGALVLPLAGTALGGMALPALVPIAIAAWAVWVVRVDKHAHAAEAV